MIDLDKKYSIRYLQLNHSILVEGYRKEQYYRIIKNKEIEYTKEKIKKYILEALGVDKNEIKEIVQLGGMTNKNYKVLINNEEYILRIPGNGTKKIINRHQEMLNSKLVADYGIDAQIVYFNQQTGVKISRMIKGAETLNPETAKKEENISKVASILRKLHESHIDMNNEFDVFNKIVVYEKLALEGKGELYKGYYNVKEEVIALKSILNENGVRLVPAHNDTVAENFIKDEVDKIYLIDWEYGGLNDELWDLAAYSLENTLDLEQEKLLLNLYFDREVTEGERIRILIHKICQDFLWSVWTIFREVQGENFGSYGFDRYKRAIDNMQLLRGIKR